MILKGGILLRVSIPKVLAVLAMSHVNIHMQLIFIAIQLRNVDTILIVVNSQIESHQFWDQLSSNI
jgi:hypothetical protein